MMSSFYAILKTTFICVAAEGTHICKQQQVFSSLLINTIGHEDQESNNQARSYNNSSGFFSLESELMKIKQVIIKGQQLRMKVLEVIVKKVLSHVDAAEFLVVLARIQDAIHQYATRQSLHKGPVKVCLKKLIFFLNV